MNMLPLPSFLRARLRSTAPLVVGVAAEPQNETGNDVSSARVISLRTPAEPVFVPVNSDDRPALITSLSSVPLDAPILTAHVGKPTFPISRDLETSLMLLEVGPRKVQLYFDPESHATGLHQAIDRLRNQLMIDQYEFDGINRPCTGDIIVALLENYKNRAQQAGGTSPDTPSKKLWESWMDIAWRARASDLHIEFMNGQAQVKVRVDGDLIPLPNDSQGTSTASQANAAVSWAYGEYTRDSSNNTSHWSAEAHIHAYAMFKPRLIDNATVTPRFQSMTGAFGPKAVLRLADKNARTLSFLEMGFAPSHKEMFENAGKLEGGLVLFTGVTGSGKTTAMKTYLETHPINGIGAINTLEEPVELPIKGTHQTSIQRELSNPELSKQQYRELIASELRMDIDGILIGEIRDDVTASGVQQILDTGHFVVSTLHSRYLSGIAGRLAQKDIGYSRDLFTAPKSLNLLSYQSLVALLCPRCRIPAVSTDEFERVHFAASDMLNRDLSIQKLRRSLDTLDKKFNVDISSLFLRRECGCEHCKGTGTHGRTVVAEMIQPDRQWLEFTRIGDDQKAIDHYRSFSDGQLLSDNMAGKTIFEHALYKSAKGLIDVRQCEAFETFDNFEVLRK